MEIVQPTKGRHKAHTHALCPEHGQYCLTCNETCPICYLTAPVPETPSYQTLNVIRAGYLGRFLGLSRISDSAINILGPEYVVRILRDIRAELETEMARYGLDVHGSPIADGGAR